MAEPKPATDLAEHRLLIAAAYIKGVYAGLVSDRAVSWRDQLAKRSWLADSHVLNHATALLRGDKLFSPLDAYQLITAAEQLGLDKPAFRARELIEMATNSRRGPEALTPDEGRPRG